MLRTLCILASLSLSHSLVVKPQNNLLRMRGGLADVDAGKVASAAVALNAVNGALLCLSPSKAGDIYECKMSEADELMITYMGGVSLAGAIMIYRIMGGTDVNTAIGEGLLPSLIQNVQGALRRLDPRPSGLPPSLLPHEPSP